MKYALPLLCMFAFLEAMGEIPTRLAPQVGSHQPAILPHQPAIDTTHSMAVNLYQASEDQFSLILSFKNYLEGSTQVELTSLDGTMVFYKTTVKEKVYQRKFNMFNLPLGHYKIEVRNRKDKMAKTLQISLTNGKKGCVLH